MRVLSPSGIAWSVCVALLVVCGVLAYLAFGTTWREGGPSREGALNSPADPEATVVCFGFADLENGVASLASMEPGRVTRILVRESDPVVAGQILLQLDDRRARSRVEETGAALRAAQVRLQEADKGQRRHEANIALQRATMAAARYRTTAARRLLARKKEQEKLNLGGTVDVAVAEDNVQELEALEQAEREKLATLKLRDPLVEKRLAEEEVSMAQQRWEQAKQLLEDCVLKAPQNGTVLRILVSPGDITGGSAKQPAILFGAAGVRLIRAEVPQEVAAQVHVGQAVHVEDDVGSAYSWAGKVVRLSDWYMQRRTIMNEPSQLKDVRTLECLIALDTDSRSLRIGQRVRVRIGISGR